jgi:nucleoside-diphosphate-sugar epimerase
LCSKTTLLVDSYCVHSWCGSYPTNPENELAKLRLTSEEGWSSLANGLRFSPLIFRLGGIYGPGRRYSPFLTYLPSNISLIRDINYKVWITFTWPVTCLFSILYSFGINSSFFSFSAVDTIIKQKPLSEGQKRRKHRKYTSRVHVEDICQALMATIYAPPSSSRWVSIYN